MKRVLWVASDAVFPPTHGGRLDINRRLVAAAHAGWIIDLVCTVRADETSSLDVISASEYCNTVRCVERDRSLSRMLSFSPFQMATRSVLCSVDLNGTHYSALIMETEYVAEILKNKTFDAKRVILRVHNIEKRYFFQLFLSERSFLRKVFYLAEATRFAIASNRVKAQADLLWYISKSEWNTERHRFPTARYVPPVATKQASRRRGESMGRVVLFVGSLFMPNNIEAVQWYLENVHAKILNVDGYELIVAGNCFNADDNMLKEIARQPRLTLNRSPRDLTDLYDRAAVFVNPMLHAAGVTLKTVEALAHGVPVVASPAGAHGTGLTEGAGGLVVRRPPDWVRVLKRILLDVPYRQWLATCAGNSLYTERQFIEEELSRM